MARAQRLAGEVDAECVTHEAAPSIGPDQPVDANGFLAGFAGKPRCHPLRILLEGHKLRAVFGAAAEFCQPLAHHAFRQKLRHHQRQLIGLCRCGGFGLDDIGVAIAAIVAIFALLRIKSTDRNDSIENAQILEYLLGPRLDSLAARAAKRVVERLDEPEGHAAPSKVDGERQAGRARAADEHIRCEIICHLDLHMCIMHIMEE